MTNYTELVKALRCKSLSKQCDSCKYGYRLCPDSECNDACHVEQIYEDAAAAIEELLPKRGEWKYSYPEIEPNPMFMYGICSICGFEQSISNKLNYCPNCGAKMNDSNALNALDNAQDGPIITPCRGCSDYDGYGGCKSKGGCARAKMEVQE